MSEANKQVALDFLAAMDSGDADGMARCITDDAVTHTKGFGQVSGWRNRETMLATGLGQSILILASFTTFAHFAASLLIVLASSAGVPACGMRAALEMRSRIAGS